MLRYFLLAGAALMALVSCQNQSSPSATSTLPEQASRPSEQDLPADFVEFYQKFHADSLYQVNHIAWPLDGDTSVEIDSTRREKRSIHWEREDWRMHRPVDFRTGEFKRTFDRFSESLIVEHISYAAANFGLERRFIKHSNGEWELIYYSDMQEIK